MRIRLHWSSLFLLLLTPGFAVAQDTTTLSKKDSLIKATDLRVGRVSTTEYWMGNQKLNYKDLQTRLNKYPESSDELRRHKAQNLTGYLVMATGFVFVIVAGIQVDNNKNMPGTVFNKAPVPFSISLGSLFGSIIILATNKHLRKSIDVYNTRVLANE